MSVMYILLFWKHDNAQLSLPLAWSGKDSSKPYHVYVNMSLIIPHDIMIVK